MKLDDLLVGARFYFLFRGGGSWKIVDGVKVEETLWTKHNYGKISAPGYKGRPYDWICARNNDEVLSVDRVVWMSKQEIEALSAAARFLVENPEYPLCGACLSVSPSDPQPHTCGQKHDYSLLETILEKLEAAKNTAEESKT